MFKNKPQILLVDDSPEFQLLISETLNKEGYNVTVYSNGLSALSEIELNLPDLIILDVIMPDMNGYDVCKELKNRTHVKDIPIIFLTALESNEDEVYGLKLGAVDYIKKPISIPILKARVKTHIDFKQNKEEILSKNKVLETLNHELEAFSYTLSHDIKKPISLILTYSGFISDRFKELNDEQGIEDIQVIVEYCRQMNNLVDDMLKLAMIKPDELELMTFDISELVKIIVEEIKVTNPTNVIDFICPPNQMVKGDFRLLRLALENIVQNAWKYSSKNDKIVIEFGTFTKENNLVYYIKDNGVGFNSENSTDMFTIFTRYHNSEDFKGTGIGLAIVKKVIDSHKGSIWIKSKPDEGTTVFFTIGNQ